MTSRSTPPVLLAGDVGGTKTSLALYRPGNGPLSPFAEATFNNADTPGFADIIESFLHDNNDIRPETACFGVAGPVRDNRVIMTNLKWILDGPSLKKRFGLRSVALINDLVATAIGATHLPETSLFTVNEGQPDPVGAISVIAPGTGLGEAFLVRHRDSLLPIPSEGGHSSFAPVGRQQRRLLHHMSKQHHHVSTEMVCSGRGIPNLYNFLCVENGTNDHLDNHPDRTRIIVETAITALDNDDPQNIALRAMQLFTAILASEAANFTLKILATGGLYIGGGIPPRILPFLQSQAFMNSFAKGEYRAMLATIPVHIILEPKTALIGAAAYAREHLILTF